MSCILREPSAHDYGMPVTGHKNEVKLSYGETGVYNSCPSCYHNNFIKQTVFKAPEGAVVTLDWNFMDIENGDVDSSYNALSVGCDYDFVWVIVDGNVTGKYCNEMYPVSYTLDEDNYIYNYETYIHNLAYDEPEQDVVSHDFAGYERIKNDFPFFGEKTCMIAGINNQRYQPWFPANVFDRPTDDYGEVINYRKKRDAETARNNEKARTEFRNRLRARTERSKKKLKENKEKFQDRNYRTQDGLCCYNRASNCVLKIPCDVAYAEFAGTIETSWRGLPPQVTGSEIRIIMLTDIMLAGVGYGVNFTVSEDPNPVLQAPTTTEQVTTTEPITTTAEPLTTIEPAFTGSSETCTETTGEACIVLDILKYIFEAFGIQQITFVENFYRKKRGAQDALDAVIGYGCWCSKPFTGDAFKGKPLDEFDQICKSWSQCSRCNGLSGCAGGEGFNYTVFPLTSSYTKIWINIILVRIEISYFWKFIELEGQ